jgi:hypothetical protein
MKLLIFTISALIFSTGESFANQVMARCPCFYSGYQVTADGYGNTAQEATDQAAETCRRIAYNQVGSHRAGRIGSCWTGASRGGGHQSQQQWEQLGQQFLQRLLPR